MPKILTICPSLNRAKKLAFMMDSFLMTRSDDTDIYVDYNEGPTTKAFNDAFNKRPDYDYYMLLNDDIIFKTKYWDLKLVQILEDYGDGIAYGDDLINGIDLPCFPMISGSIVRALGWLQMPTLDYLCGDVVWKYIGEEAKCLRYVPDVIIQHNHHIVTGEQDETAKKTNSKEQYEKDRLAYVNWLAYKSYEDIKKVKKVIYADNR